MRIVVVLLLAGVVALAARNDSSVDAPAPSTLDRSRDTVHALVVFVRFPDDEAQMAEWPLRDASGRPRSLLQLPPFGVNLFETEPSRVNAETLTLGDSSLSAYFYWQSRNGPRGPHVLTGDTWPRDRKGRPVVYITAHENAHYTDPIGPDGTVQDTGVGYGELVKEILETVVRQPGFDIADYDLNADGVLDHMFLVVRRDIAFYSAGIQRLGAHRRAGGRFPTLRFASPREGREVKVQSNSGNIVWIGEMPPRPSLIHEYGHDLFEMVHTRIIETNDVPFDVPPRGERGHAACRYSAMCGVNASSAKSNYDPVPSLGSHEMIRMGWADVRQLSPDSGATSTHTIGPLYTTGQVVEVPLAEGSGAEVLRLESRQRVGYFNNYPATFVPLPDGRPNPDYGVIWRDLAATGLLITLSQGDPDGPASRYRYDLLLPTNSVHFGPTRCSGTLPGCHPKEIDAETMYRPGVATQITPWTRPNVSGYTHYPDGVAPNWFAIDQIRYTGDADSTMAFEFIPDIRRADEIVLRQDSWMGEETSGTTFRQLVRVEPGATLTIEAGTRVTFAGGLTVERGARFVCERGATCRR
ncbi:MAG: hypothetical protein AAF170_05230 [Bacteroidota bacterium]